MSVARKVCPAIDVPLAPRCAVVGGVSLVSAFHQRLDCQSLPVFHEVCLVSVARKVCPAIDVPLAPRCAVVGGVDLVSEVLQRCLAFVS